MYTITEVAGKYGVSKNTLRYYESEGLLVNIHRDSNGTRSYSDDDLEEIGKVIHLRNMGASIKEIKDFLFNEKEVTASELREKIIFLDNLDNQLIKKLTDIKEQREYLSRKKERFEHLLKSKEVEVSIGSGR
ncbi:MerR family transcriptional regulator [Enterococcus avium]|uniref:MerR family transcriptional regulator n=1 Tax=Enterococcus TaxID=1350 RepID=UPI00289250B5|nr:MerR family transcriptional regulator [Enterococcus avium]MDT2493736.1 MerR family transcriptional regulator [Enterococcus avium]